MKHSLLICLFCLVAGISGAGTVSLPTRATPPASVRPHEDKVLICISPGSFAYHARRCRGLAHCTHEIKEVTVKEAVALKRTPCGYCW